MDGCALGQLDILSEQIATAVKSLRNRADVAKNKATILASVEGIRAVLDNPADFLQRLAVQMELLACLKWLAEFQILACIPQEVSLPLRDLADLAGVPEATLRRIVRLMASVGFLQETKPGFVSHTALSAQYLASQSLADATLFITATAAPSALHMVDATRLAAASARDHGHHHHPSSREPRGILKGVSPTAYDLALRSPRPFGPACYHEQQERPSKLGRQWNAYLTHAATSHSESQLVEIFSGLNWSSLGTDACIVEVGAQSTSMARALAKAFPNLYFFVQIGSSDTLPLDGHPHHEYDRGKGSTAAAAAAAAIPITADGKILDGSDGNSRIIVTFRGKGMPQPITGAAVYILHILPEAELARAELFRHLRPLRASGGILLVLTTRILPEPGSLPDRRLEAVARARDLAILQLAGEGEMEMAELRQVVDSVTDDFGRLVVANELRSHDGLVLALALKHLQH